MPVSTTSLLACGLPILLLQLVTVSADSFTQSWNISERFIPMEEIKADCASGELSEVILSLKGINPNQCAGQGPSFYKQYKTFLQSEFTRCYSNPRCTQIVWNKQAFVFGCSSSAEEKSLRESLRLVAMVTCEISSDLHLYNIDKTTRINASTPLCPNGQHQKISHIFTITHCPKPMVLGSEAWSALNSLVNAMEDCGELCPPIETSNFKLQTLSCEGQSKVKNVAIGAYWTCDETVTRKVVTPTPKALTNKAESLSGTESTGTGDDKKGRDKNLVALIVMSLLFAVCLTVLILVLVYFLYCKRKRMEKKFTMPAGRRPPSKDTLYGRSRGSSRRKLLGSMRSTSTASSSDRYVTEAEHNSKNVELAKLETEYAVPLTDCGGTEDKMMYENEDDTYEVVDVVKPQTAPRRTNTTQSGYVPMNKKPMRNNSEKYSDGYLIPSVLRKEESS